MNKFKDENIEIVTDGEGFTISIINKEFVEDMLLDYQSIHESDLDKLCGGRLSHLLNRIDELK